MSESAEKALVSEMLEKLRLIRDLMRESDGVTGYHINGMIMPWGEWEDLSLESLNELIDKVDSCY